MNLSDNSRKAYLQLEGEGWCAENMDANAMSSRASTYTNIRDFSGVLG